MGDVIPNFQMFYCKVTGTEHQWCSRAVLNMSRAGIA